MSLYRTGHGVASLPSAPSLVRYRSAASSPLMYLFSVVFIVSVGEHDSKLDGKPRHECDGQCIGKHDDDLF